MARLTVPAWTPDPVPSLPIVSTLRFRITPGALAAHGVVVEYVLHSDQARIRPGPPPPALLQEEVQGSTPSPPDLVPRVRGTFLVIDRYPAARPGEAFTVERVLALDPLPGGTSGFMSMTVTVSDLTADEVPVNPAVRSRTISVDV